MSSSTAASNAAFFARLEDVLGKEDVAVVASTIAVPAAAPAAAASAAAVSLSPSPPSVASLSPSLPSAPMSDDSTDVDEEEPEMRPLAHLSQAQITTLKNRGISDALIRDYALLKGRVPACRLELVVDLFRLRQGDWKKQIEPRIMPLLYRLCADTMSKSSSGTRQCLSCDKEGRFCIEIQDAGDARVWRCLYAQVTPGEAIIQPRKRKTASPGPQVPSPAAAAAAGAGSDDVANKQPAPDSTAESPLKKRKANPSPLERMMPEHLLEFIPSLTAASLICSYVQRDTCGAPTCSGAIGGDVRTACDVCKDDGGHQYCKGCLFLHQRTKSHMAAVKAAASEKKRLAAAAAVEAKNAAKAKRAVAAKTEKIARLATNAAAAAVKNAAPDEASALAFAAAFAVVAKVAPTAPPAAAAAVAEAAAAAAVKAHNNALQAAASAAAEEEEESNAPDVDGDADDDNDASIL